MGEIHSAAELILDALDAYEDAGYYDRDSGVIDMQVSEIAGALLAAGWQVPQSSFKNYRELQAELEARPGHDQRAAIARARLAEEDGV